VAATAGHGSSSAARAKVRSSSGEPKILTITHRVGAIELMPQRRPERRRRRPVAGSTLLKEALRGERHDTLEHLEVTVFVVDDQRSSCATAAIRNPGATSRRVDRGAHPRRALGPPRAHPRIARPLHDDVSANSRPSGSARGEIIDPCEDLDVPGWVVAGRPRGKFAKQRVPAGRLIHAAPGHRGWPSRARLWQRAWSTDERHHAVQRLRERGVLDHSDALVLRRHLVAPKCRPRQAR